MALRSFPRSSKATPSLAHLFGAAIKGSISLDALCFSLGLEGKGDVDGSMVAQMWADGKHDEIGAYCRDDVARVRRVHQKMLAALGEAA
ncbi:hypothetical protein [Agrobacterium pusense]|uniref:hypothetical protein n=1 Tax=Agrobacterium pusense TaxID=648995 RepID=UPI003C7B2DE5